MEKEDFDASALLEEVFNEVDSLEESNGQQVKATKPGFLEDVVDLEKKGALNCKNVKQKNKSEQKFDLKKFQQEIKSLIHEGLTDSSDDEDNKYFEENKYNECGKNIKNLLKQTTVSKELFTKEAPKVEGTWAKAQAAKEKLKAQLSQSGGSDSTKSGLLVDPIFGMRIINPLVSSKSLQDKMIGRVAIRSSKIKEFVNSPAVKESDWVTGGAIIGKMSKTSQKGNPYCLWYVTDLMGDIKITCVFLFGSAYKEYWKTSLGTVVGILNPDVIEGRDKTEATIKVDNAQKIMLIGTSKDYGICKSKKSNGENCSSVVNTAKCEFCVFHLKKEYSKACRRSDLQPPKIGRSLDNLRAKVLGKNEVFYAGKSFTAVVGKKSAKHTQKDKQKLEALSQRVPGPVKKTQQSKDKDILNRLNQSPVLGTNSIIQCPSKPKQDLIDLNFTISKKDRNAAKASALKYIQKHGPIKKVTDGDKTKRTPEQILSLKRKLESEKDEEVKKSKTNESETPKGNPLKEKLTKYGITDEFLKVMNLQVQDEKLLKLAEIEEKEKYFEKLEMREKIEDKMASTFKVEYKAVRCLKCNYKSFSASELCKKEKHPLKVVNAVKRFWKCGDCSARTVCLELVPLHSCKNCGSSKWERASMMPEKKGPNLTVEPLSLRGHEEKYIGGAAKNANLNLLVPDDAS